MRSKEFKNEGDHFSGRWRGVVASEVRQCLGTPIFLEDAVNIVLSELQNIAAKHNVTEVASEAHVRRLAKIEAKRLKGEIERRFVRTGKLQL